jgi:hypothetical protein
MTASNGPAARNDRATDIVPAASESDATTVPPTAAVATLTATEADRLTTKIQLRLTAIADNSDAVVPLIEQARIGDAHVALGFRSWTEYVSAKFGGALARLTRGERLPLVELLSDQGMSTRAIASVVGASKSTVADDLSGVQIRTPGHGTAKPTVVGIDGKKYRKPKAGAVVRGLRKWPRRDPAKAMDSALSALGGICIPMQQLKPADLDGAPDELRRRWARDIDRYIADLRRLRKKLDRGPS